MEHAHTAEDLTGKASGRARIAYWIVTGFFGIAMVGSSFVDLMRNEMFMATLDRLGYPPYLAEILGVAKLLGAAAILFTRWRSLTEWAYAGFTIYLIGAVVSHFAVGDPVSSVGTLFFFLAVLGTSYVLWKRK